MTIKVSPPPDVIVKVSPLARTIVVSPPNEPTLAVSQKPSKLEITTGLRGPIGPPGLDDANTRQWLPALVTAGDGDQASSVALAYDPRPESDLYLEVNGWTVSADGYYWSVDGGLHATAPFAGATLHWRGSEVGFELDTSDTLAVVYERVL